MWKILVSDHVRKGQNIVFSESLKENHIKYYKKKGNNNVFYKLDRIKDKKGKTSNLEYTWKFGTERLSNNTKNNSVVAGL